MHEFAIFDFDGTITNLNVDWKSLKAELRVETISEIWNLPKQQKKEAHKIVSEFELRGLSYKLIFNENLFTSMNHFSVLTNNSEKIVRKFFNGINSNSIKPIIDPFMVLGRETLQGPKENKTIFATNVNRILDGMKIKSPESCIYVGDQEYELDFADKIGLIPVHINDFKML